MFARAGSRVGCGKGLGAKQYRISCLDDVDVLELDSGDGCIALSAQSLNYILKIIRDHKFMLCVVSPQPKHFKES